MHSIGFKTHKHIIVPCSDRNKCSTKTHKHPHKPLRVCRKQTKGTSHWKLIYFQGPVKCRLMAFQIPTGIHLSSCSVYCCRKSEMHFNACTIATVGNESTGLLCSTASLEPRLTFIEGKLELGKPQV